MSKRITYQKLILQIILITLTISLSMAFVYAQYMKHNAIESLAKNDARKTTQLIFQSLYSAMQRGWTNIDIQNIINQINDIDKNMHIDIYRGHDVAIEYGKTKKDLKNKQNIYVKEAFNKKEVLNIPDDSSIDYYYPIVAKNECLRCHTKTKEGNVLGVINISYPIDDLKVSLASIINFFIIFTIVFSILIFLSLFTEFNKHLIKPIKHFIIKINSISKNKNISQRIFLNNNTEELNDMQKVFNEMLDSIEYQFYYDQLTHLPNRKKLIECLDKEEHSVLMIINIDNFQEINDLYGDKIGNSILKTTAELLKKEVSQNSSLFKLHADEYAIYFETSLSCDKIKRYANHLNKTIENHIFIINESEIFINVSIGISEGTKLLLNNADSALKLAKKKKAKFLIYDLSMNIENEYEQNLKWSKRIKDAIKENRIEPLFQPIVNTKTNKIEKYEALIRMIDEKGEYISPIHFLELAKKNKLYPQLTIIMLKKTFSKLKSLNIQVSINLSLQDILDEDVHKLILEKLHKYQLQDKIVFELLESEGIENFTEVKNFIEEVKNTGAKISIDDFGTGYSNFEYLMKLDVDYIKIDASMIKNIHIDKNSKMVTETIIDFAKKMNIKTIAEFVHSKEVYDVITKMGIDYAQGYYFGEAKKLK